MNLLSKIKKRLNGTPVASTAGDTRETVESLNKLSDTEKEKVLDYLNTIKDLHKAHGK